MAFTTEAIDNSGPVKVPTGPAEFDLPVREFIGYDKKGTTSVTGSPIVRQDQVITKQETTVETVAEPTAAPEESVQLSPQITAIARKEHAQRKREQDFETEKKTFAQKLADADKYAALQAKIKAKDYSAADELGLNYDEYTQYLVDKQAKTNPEDERYRKVESELSELKKNQEDQTLKEYNQNQALWKQEIAKTVGDNPEFSTIKELGLEAMVLQHVNDSFEEDGIELTAEEAAKEIEAAAVERAEKFASVSKIKNRSSEPPKVLGAPKTAPKTITQGMTVSSEKASSKPFHLMSESEQIAEAYRRVQLQRTQGR
jgi:hypothetical protein